MRIFVRYIFDRGLLFKVYKELKSDRVEEINDLIKNELRIFCLNVWVSGSDIF